MNIFPASFYCPISLYQVACLINSLFNIPVRIFTPIGLLALLLASDFLI